MKNPGILVAVLLLLALAIPTAHAKIVIPINSDGEVVLPEYVPLWPICVYPRKHARQYGEQPCPCERIYTEPIRSLCYFPRRHIKVWRKRGYCQCVVYITPAVRNQCYNPRGHFRAWKRGGPCPCVGRWPPKDQVYGEEG